MLLDGIRMIRIDTGFLFIKDGRPYFRDFIFHDANYEIFSSALFEPVSHEIVMRIHPSSYWMVLE